MSRRHYALLLALAIAWPTAAARGQQDVLIPQSPNVAAGDSGRNLSIAPLDDTQVFSTTPMFIDSSQVGPNFGAGFTGTVNGSGVRGVNGQNVSNLTVGFDYLRPFWSFHNFGLAVPPTYASNFPAVGTLGNTNNAFAFVPRVQYDYYVSDFNTSISASGKFLSLSGSLQREVASTTGGGIGNLTANSNLNIISFNAVEFSKRFEFEDLFGSHDKPKIADSVVDLSIGGRYVQLDQSYSGTLQDGQGNVNITSRYSRQFYRGIGLTTAANWLCPLSNNFVGFTSMRASIVVGNNQRDSSLNVTVAGQPGVANTINESKTMYAPIGETEIGVEWGRDLGEALRHRVTQQQVIVRVSCIGQIWGGMGPLSAGSSQGFRTSDLFLTGVSVSVGYRH